MNSIPGVYRYESSRNRETGEPTEREYRRKGHLLTIALLKIDYCMLIEYVDGSGVLRTSAVESIDETDDLLIVTTLNTIYTFERVG
ncbi:hypothetical protein [Siminovitchia sp. 179-K 8D1 HS]|uniref:hypothetical protein n=1 Tax=Siminovitchia sp. 179-K 8D1 HS TaxID=3142385 RepID=UPI0039A120A1